MKKEPLFCQRCQIQTKYVIDSFARYHLLKEHNMTMKNYYDCYLKEKDEEKCINCGDICQWDNSVKGYRTYCSTKCMGSDLNFIEKCKKRSAAIDHVKAATKRKETCIKKYGVEYVSQLEEVKKKVIETNMNTYGCESTLSLPGVSEARNKALLENADTINEKRKKWWENNKNSLKVKESRSKTMISKYGVENLFSTPEMQDSIREVNYKSGYWIPLEQKSEWAQYCFKVKKETEKHIEELFSTWGGKCYYFDYILTTGKSNSAPLSITIDHKVSKKWGFINNISPEIIGRLENLCICSRIINCAKNHLTEEEFYKSDVYLKYKGTSNDQHR